MNEEEKINQVCQAVKHHPDFFHSIVLFYIRLELEKKELVLTSRQGIIICFKLFLDKLLRECNEAEDQMGVFCLGQALSSFSEAEPSYLRQFLRCYSNVLEYLYLNIIEDEKFIKKISDWEKSRGSISHLSIQSLSLIEAVRRNDFPSLRLFLRKNRQLCVDLNDKMTVLKRTLKKSDSYLYSYPEITDVAKSYAFSVINVPDLSGRTAIDHAVDGVVKGDDKYYEALVAYFGFKYINCPEPILDSSELNFIQRLFDAGYLSKKIKETTDLEYLSEFCAFYYNALDPNRREAFLKVYIPRCNRFLSPLCSSKRVHAGIKDQATEYDEPIVPMQASSSMSYS